MTDFPTVRDLRLAIPKAVRADVIPCNCTADHRPRPLENHVHHILPLAWGGTDQPDNLIVLCPTTHARVHVLLRELARTNGRVPGPLRRAAGPYVVRLAYRGWDRRPK